MKLVEITEKEFIELDNNLSNLTYFCNGCVFEEDTDNLVAFAWYASPDERPSKWLKVVEE